MHIGLHLVFFGKTGVTAWREPAGVRALNGSVGEQVRGRFARGSPRARRTSSEGAFSPRARRTSPEGCLALERGGPCPRGRLGQLFWWASGATGVAIMLCVFWACGFVCICVFYKRRWVFPGFLWTLMAVPDNSHYLAVDTGKPCCLLCTRQGNVIVWERGEESD
jgi:hypothetical protein